MQDQEALMQMQRLMDAVEYGEIQFSVKKHNSQIAAVSAPYSKNLKVDYTKAMAYIMEQLRDAQLSKKTGSVTFTITFTNGNIKQLAEVGYITENFKIAP